MGSGRMDGSAYLFSLPYWLFVDPAAPPAIVEVKVAADTFRLYPPFRDKPVHSLTAPHCVDPARIPFRPHRRPPQSFRVLPAPISLPKFAGADVKFWWAHISGNFQELPPEEDLPKDFVRIDAYSSQSEGLGPRTIGLFQALMEALRWRSGQWWITRSSQGLSRATHLLFPVTEGGNVAAARTHSSGEVGVFTLDGCERRVTDAIWREAIKDACGGAYVPFYDLLVLDALYFQSIGDLRQAVLQADAACEHLKEIVFERLWTSRNPGKTYDSKRRRDLLRTWDLPRHLDVKFSKHFRRSYKQEHPTEYQLVNDLWEARNNVAHGGQNVFGQPPVQVQSEQVKQFIYAAKHCITWLLDLQ